jgi:hypothetical protein
MDEIALEKLLWDASKTTCGVEVATPDAEYLRRKLYQAREKARSGGVYAFDSLTFGLVPNNNKKLLIMKEIANVSKG